MKKKLLKLYKEDFQNFVKLVSYIYKTDDNGLQKVLVDKYNPNECYFIIDGMLTSVETIIQYMMTIEDSHKILVKAKVTKD
jgi:hypothetical protein